MQALDADKCILSRRKMHCWLSQRLLWSRACLYEHSGGGGGGGGVGQDHMCTIIADSLMSTSNEMKCVVPFFTHHETLQALSVTHARISLPHA